MGKEIIVVGDLNCDVLKPDSPSAIALLNFSESVNLTQLIKEPTRVTENSTSLIDVIMTSNVNLVENHGVVSSHISDHYLTYVLVKLKMPKPSVSYICTRSYKNYESDRLLADLQQVPWYEISLVDDVNEMLALFNERFLDVLEKHAPVKIVKIKNRRCPFVNTEIRKLMKHRDGILTVARCTRLHSEWEKYRELRNIVKSKLRKAEREYVRMELDRSKKISSKWKIIRNCIPRKETTQQVYTRDHKEVVNEFNQFFISVGARAAEDSLSLIDLYNLPAPSTSGSTVIPESHKFHFEPVMCREVRRIVMAFQSNKAPGYDKVRMSTVSSTMYSSSS